jgi:hypothetical protein
MRPIPFPLGLPLALSVLLLSGCCDCDPAPLPAPMAVPVAAAAQREPAPYQGVARYFGQPLEGAEVLVVPFGAEPVATAHAGADGKFAYRLPASVAPGTLLKFVARRGDVTVVTLAPVPERRLLQASESDAGWVVIDEYRTLAFYVLAPRLEAISLLAGAANAGGTTSPLASQAVKAFGETVSGLTANPAPIAPAALNALGKTVDVEGRVEASPALIDALVVAVPPAYMPLLKKQAETLGEVIRQEVNDHGRARPPEALTREVPLTRSQTANQVVPSVFGDPAPAKAAPPATSAGSSGPSTATVTGTVEIAPGEVEDTTDAPTITLEPEGSVAEQE